MVDGWPKLQESLHELVKFLLGLQKSTYKAFFRTHTLRLRIVMCIARNVSAYFKFTC